MMKFHLSALLLALLIAWLPGCGDDVGVGGRPGGAGGLSQTSAPECGVFDQACVQQGLDAPFALGSKIALGVVFQLSGSSGPPVELRAADPSILTTDGANVEAVGEGATALLFLGPDGVVLDFLHVWVAAPDELKLLSYSRNGDLLGEVQPSITLLAGDELLVSLEPFLTGQPMLGNYTLNRSVDDETVVAVVPDAVGGWYRLVARQPGDVTVRFEALGLERTLRVEVTP